MSLNELGLMSGQFNHILPVGKVLLPETEPRFPPGNQEEMEMNDAKSCRRTRAPR